MDNRPIKILLVEDNPGDVRLVQEALNEAETCRFDLVCSESLNKALTYLDKNSCDIILLDLSLPDAQRLEALQKILEAEKNVPVVVLTCNDDELLGINALKVGAQDYLVKGQVEGHQLVRSIHYAIERYKMQVQLKKARQLEHHLAYHDILTDLPNRQLFFDRLKQAMIRAKRYKTMAAVLFLDFDDFKRINDTLGHSAGDYLLQAAANRLISCVRKSDTVARIAGDEFTIILDGIADSTDASMIARKILKSLSKPFIMNSHELFITASIGISLFPKDANDIELLVTKADTAMYRAKEIGKNNYQHYDKSFDITYIQHLATKERFGRAIEDGEIVVYYQPQIDIDTGEITGIEALARWQHPELGIIPPAGFIPMAEELGLIKKIDEWVLYSACAQNKAWQDEGFLPIRVAVNLSACQFRDGNFPETVKQTLNITRLKPEYLELEITEKATMQDIEHTISMMNKLRDLGVRFSLDDFGTGYSSLNHLGHFPIDMLKIDQSLIYDIPNSHNNSTITSAIVALAHNLELQAIAEGVENDEQLSFLRQLKCDRMQGFHFSPPLPADDITNLLRLRDGCISENNVCV